MSRASRGSPVCMLLGAARATAGHLKLRRFELRKSRAVGSLHIRRKFLRPELRHRTMHGERASIGASHSTITRSKP